MYLLGMFVYIVRGLTGLALICLVFIPPELNVIIISQRFPGTKQDVRGMGHD